MCVKDWGKRVCVEHIARFSTAICLRLGTLWSFAVSSNHDVSDVPLFMKELFLTLWLCIFCQKESSEITTGWSEPYFSAQDSWTSHPFSGCIPLTLSQHASQLFFLRFRPIFLGFRWFTFTKTRTIFETWNLKNGSTLGVASNILDSMIPQIPRLSNIGLILIGKRSPYVFCRCVFSGSTHTELSLSWDPVEDSALWCRWPTPRTKHDFLGYCFRTTTQTPKNGHHKQMNDSENKSL